MNNKTKLNYDPSEPNIKNIVIVAVISIITVVIFSISVYYLYIALRSSQLNQKIIEGVRPYSLRQLQKYEKDQLNSIEWVDRGKQIVKIPLPTAIDLVVEEYNN